MTARRAEARGTWGTGIVVDDVPELDDAVRVSVNGWRQAASFVVSDPVDRRAIALAICPELAE